VLENDWRGHVPQISVSVLFWVAVPLAAGVVRTTRRDVGESARPGLVDRDASVSSEPGSFFSSVNALAHGAQRNESRAALLAWSGDVIIGFVSLTDPTSGIPTPIPRSLPKGHP
jgi:hypothetical protein